MQNKYVKHVILFLGIVLTALVGYRLTHHSTSNESLSGIQKLAQVLPGLSSSSSENDNSSEPFALLGAIERSFEGSPALMLTFNHRLDTRTAYDRFIRVFEMPLSAEQLKQAQSDGSSQDDSDEDHSRTGHKKASNLVSTRPEDTNPQGGKPVSGAWVIGENPRLLFFPHIKPDTRYVIQVLAPFPAPHGGNLKEALSYSVTSASVSPAYYFASNGMVLPAKQNGGLPVVTVNVPEIDVQFLRVKPDQLPRFLDRVINAKPKPSHGDTARAEEDDDEGDHDSWRRSSLHGAVNNYQLDDLKKMTESVYLGRFLAEQKVNKRSVTYLPVEEIKELKTPGVYIAIMSRPGRFSEDYQTTYFYVSDLGLHTRVYEKSADAYVSSLRDGKALSGVEVSWLNIQGKVLASVETDRDGHAYFAERPKGAHVILARQGDQLAMLTLKEPALDLSEYDINGDRYKPVRLFAYSGRNLYRPGERFDLSVLARDEDGRSLPSRNLQARLRRPDGKDQWTAMWGVDKRFSGYFSKAIELPLDAPTGFWTLELRTDPADKIPATVFRFGVEEFLPERMKLALTPNKTELKREDDYSVHVSGTYLYGAPASANRTLGVVQFERNKNPLAKQFPGYEFGDVVENDIKVRKELDELKLDEAGKGVFHIDLSPIQGRDSPFTVKTTVSLLENGGRPVVRSLEQAVWPASSLIGIRPLFSGDYASENSPVEFEVIHANSKGSLLAATALSVRLFREDRDYYWRFEDQRGWQSGFTETDELVENTSMTILGGKRGKIRLPVKYGRYRLEVLDPVNSLKTSVRFYAGWNAHRDETQGVRPDKVAMKLDKPAYKNGDVARLSLTPPHAGEALITVESDRTLWLKRVSLSAGTTTLDIPVKSEWKRHDIYVSAIVMRAGNQGDKVTPTRALGLIHLPLERVDRKMNVLLEAPAKVLPDTTARIKIRVPDAKLVGEANYLKAQTVFVTLSAVDVGILNITRFVSPDPHAFFFSPLHYGADQYDVYGRLIEKMQGQKGKLKFGGDNTPKATKSLPKKVRLVDIFSGPIALNAQGEAEISIKIPDFNGTLRLMAVVAGEDRFGAKEAEMIVAAPLIVELATPRFLSFGDHGLLALDIHNLSGTAQNLSIKLDGSKAFKITDAARTISIKNQERQTLRFPIEALTWAGLHMLDLDVKGGKLHVHRQFPLTVQAPTPYQQITKNFVIKPNELLNLKEADLLGFHSNSVLSHLVISNQPPLDVRSAIQGLLTYPYGCVEQTTSTAYPHVFVDSDAARRFGLKVYTREQRIDMLDKAIAKLAAMQAPNGGFSLWGGASSVEYWLSAYVTQFMLDAREQGFNVPDTTLKKAVDFLLQGLQEGAARLPAKDLVSSASAVNWESNGLSDNSQFGVLSYGAYVLARQHRAPLSTLRQLYEVRGLARSGLNLIQLGVALRLMGDTPKSDVILAEGLKKPRVLGYGWYDYGSNIRDLALSYALLKQHKIVMANYENLMVALASEIEKNQYYSTQEKLALFLVGREYDQQQGKWSATLQTKASTFPLNASASLFHELDTSALTQGITLKNTHSAPLYAALSVQGFPLKMPSNKSDLIELTRKMYTPDGVEMSKRPLIVGETIIMHVTVRAKADIKTGLLIDRIPAGLEIENTHIVQGENMAAIKIDKVDPVEAMNNSRIKHVEFRDDRFVAAVHMNNEPIHLFYRVRVVTPGTFVIPPLYAEDMYHPEIMGHIYDPHMLTIVEAKRP